MDQSGAWSQWESLGGWHRQINALRQNNGCLEVIALGRDYKNYRIIQSSPGGDWTQWQRMLIPDISGFNISGFNIQNLMRQLPDLENDELLSIDQTLTLSFEEAIPPSTFDNSSKSSEELFQECEKAMI